jgi:hypothetical protein
MKAKHYQLTPIPKAARRHLGWFALCFFALIFSPFVGFAIHGKVETPGLIIGLKFAILPLLGLAAIAILREIAWRRLPPELVREFRQGKLVPADGAPVVVPPVRFANGDCWIRMSRDGVTASKQTLISMPGVPQMIAKVRAVAESGEVSARWSDVVEWSIEEDSDGPDYHWLQLRGGGAIKLRRFAPKQATESDILDAVRSVGKVPVRLRSAVNETRNR